MYAFFFSSKKGSFGLWAWMDIWMDIWMDQNGRWRWADLQLLGCEVQRSKRALGALEAANFWCVHVCTEPDIEYTISSFKWSSYIPARPTAQNQFNKQAPKR